jgi:hypothetical protein
VSERPRRRGTTIPVRRARSRRNNVLDLRPEPPNSSAFPRTGREDGSGRTHGTVFRRGKTMRESSFQRTDRRVMWIPSIIFRMRDEEDDSLV